MTKIQHPLKLKVLRSMKHTFRVLIVTCHQCGQTTMSLNMTQHQF